MECRRAAHGPNASNSEHGMTHFIRYEHDLRRRVGVSKRQLGVRLESRGIGLIVELRRGRRAISMCNQISAAAKGGPRLSG